MIRFRPLAVSLVLVVVLSALAPAGALAAPDAEDLSLVASDDGVVTVTANGSAVENATVEVSTDGNESYAGAGSYATDADGEVDLPDPEESVTVTITASTTADVVEMTTVLEPAAEDDVAENLTVDVHNLTVSVGADDGPVENATVTVTPAEANASYVGTGTRSTDADGEVDLPAPDETVDVTVTAAAGNASAETTATLEAGDDEERPENFGARVSAFVDQLTTDGPRGLAIADFVTDENPGAAPAHAGPPDDGADADENETDADDESDALETAGDDDTDERGGGPPSHAGSNGNSGGGPPAAAGP